MPPLPEPAPHGLPDVKDGQVEGAVMMTMMGSSSEDSVATAW